MAEEAATNSNSGKPLIAATVSSLAAPCMDVACRTFHKAGYEVQVFDAGGSGAERMESLIRAGAVSGVLDLTTTELANQLLGGALRAGRDRLTAAAIKSVPQVISLGGLDQATFGPRVLVPDKLDTRRFYQQDPSITVVRTTPEENDQLGKEIAEKASAARGPTAILMPLQGLSTLDVEGGVFWWPEADQALFQSLRNWMSPHVELVELDLHINDPAFAEAAASKLLSLLRR
ncbi:MAG: Tm-1-like ATP-binding domain-containing protein [Gemmataceae bacterium]